MLKEIRWHGRGGQGSFTGAKLLGTAASLHDDRFAQAFPSFGPERRGAPVLGFNRISDRPITDRSEIGLCDFIIFLDDTLWSDRYFGDLKKDALILINTADKNLSDARIRTIDATGLALEILGLPIANTAMLGALAALSRETVSYNALVEALKSSLKTSVLEKNLILLEKAYERF
ncbi:2-oxoacid:acceptor oxidoreductase family protein [Spirochaeta isovalerica]|uniref:Pyruvate ferredoxin oxidoreductase gamma subunit n=1 Tax=Spirochaeta isovalerica TaxID=150 RepID=A0A841RBV1_9SPIO|nr:2-oxoacid:acceptor oxidoreductase family protein [Spirochaeta isovalerica]MBB6480707.1 pyruvate ferredoxin oxidoreductase gamma subunit [Spirochaeta isovalerica]